MGGDRGSGVVKKYKEEMTPGGTNAVAVEHTVWSACLILWPQEGILSVKGKKTIQAIRTPCNLAYKQFGLNN